MYSRIVGTGSYLPEKVAHQLRSREDDGYHRRVDPRPHRHRAPAHRRRRRDHRRSGRERPRAARIEAAGVDAGGSRLHRLRHHHARPRSSPTAACCCRRASAARGGPAFSVETACSGFIYALSIADKFVKAGEAKCALVVGAETLSRITDWKDRATARAVRRRRGRRGAQAVGGAGHPVHAPACRRRVQGPAVCATPASRRASSDVSRAWPSSMAGNEVFKVAVTKLGQAVDEALAANGLEKSAIDWLVPHQANIRIIQAMARKLDLPMERVIVTVQDHGNTSAASVPLALDVGVRDGRIKRGQLLLLEAFGGGFTWGSALVTVLRDFAAGAPAPRCASRCRRSGDSYALKPKKTPRRVRGVFPVRRLTLTSRRSDGTSGRSSRSSHRSRSGWPARQRGPGWPCSAHRSPPGWRTGPRCWPNRRRSSRRPDPTAGGSPALEVINLRLQRLEIRAASQHGYDCCSGHFHNDRALHTRPLLGCWFGKIPETTAGTGSDKHPAFARAQLHQICHVNATGKTRECLSHRDSCLRVGCECESAQAAAEKFSRELNFFHGLLDGNRAASGYNHSYCINAQEGPHVRPHTPPDPDSAAHPARHQRDRHAAHPRGNRAGAGVQVGQCRRRAPARAGAQGRHLAGARHLARHPAQGHHARADGPAAHRPRRRRQAHLRRRELRGASADRSVASSSRSRITCSRSRA